MTSNKSALSPSKINLGEDIDIVVGATALALTADQLVKAARSKKHKTSHFIKASLGAAVAVAAWNMFQREHHENDHDHKHHHQHPHSGEDPESEYRNEHRSIRDRSPSPSNSRHFSNNIVRYGHHNQVTTRAGNDWYDSVDDFPRRPNSAHGYPAVRQDNDSEYGQELVYRRSRSYSPSQNRRSYRQ